MNICLWIAEDLLEKEIKICKCMHSKKIRMLYKIENVVLFGASIINDSYFFMCLPIILPGIYMVSFIIR